MKNWIVFLFVLLSFTVQAQEWRKEVAMARQAYAEGQYQKAYTYYQRAQKNAPNTVNLSQELAQTAYKLQDYYQAEQWFRKQAYQSTDNAQRAKNNYNLGTTLAKQNKYELAIEAYQEAIRYDPTNDKIKHNLLEVLKQKRQTEIQAQQESSQTDMSIKDTQIQTNQQNQINKTSDAVQPSSVLKSASIEKKLDELAKQELLTRQQMNRQAQSSRSKKIIKDW